MTINVQVSYKAFKKYVFSTLAIKIIVLFWAMVLVNAIVVTLINMGGNFAEGGAANIAQYTVVILVFFMLLPFVLLRSIKKSYDTNKLLHEPITYEFAGERLKVSGVSFNSEFDWNKFYQIKETKGYFMIYPSASALYLIPKSCLSDSEITSLKTFFLNLKGIKLLLK
jgi:YcxB-like protein